METAVIVGLIALFGPILGFAASFVLQALQRKWALDDQRRGWKRENLIELLESYQQLDKVLSKIYFDAAYTKKYWIEFQDLMADFVMHWMPINDSKLDKLYNPYFDKLTEFINRAEDGIEDEKEFRLLIDDVSRVGTKFLKRINTLIDETYK